MVQYVWVRDLLHKHFDESANKTSHACQRRINYMMKNKTTLDNVTLFLADVQQDHEVKSPRKVPIFHSQRLFVIIDIPLVYSAI